MNIKYKDGFITDDWHELALEFMADPTNHQSIKSFCKENNVMERRFHRWKTKFRNEIAIEAEKRRKEYVSQVRMKAWKALDQRIDKGSDKALELVFKLLGDFVERSEQRIDYMRPEDKIERVKQLLAGVLAKKAQEDKPSGAPPPMDDRPTVLPGPTGDTH